ncbi:MAG: PAS domain-containing protein [Candidatus Omnitrophica bacterium]|nr:PAS domain-containing protein [Candidatus Omnitrophota bacterium]MCB9747944.1 PAS domain-containing protein [Candidatus Omnitrophota bacterium]
MTNYPNIKKPSEKLKGLLGFAGIDINDFLPAHHKSFKVVHYTKQDEDMLSDIRTIISDNINVISSRSRVDEYLGATNKAQKERCYCDDETMWLLLKDMLDSWVDAIFFKNLDGELILVNEAHARGMCSKFSNVIGKRDTDLFPLEEALRMIKDDEYVIKTGKPIVNKTEYITFGDGTRHYVSTTKVPRRDADGNIVGIMGISRDVTNDLYQSLFASYKGCIYICTKEGKWFDINEEGARMFGYDSREEFLENTNVQDIYFNKRDRKKNTSYIERNGGVKNFEFRFRKKDNTPIDIQVTANVIMRDGKVWGYNGTMRDVTSERRLFEEYQKKIKLLRKRILNLKKFILKGISCAFHIFFDEGEEKNSQFMDTLTARQRELFPLFILGKTDKEIAEMTQFTEAVISKCRYDIYMAKYQD